MAVKGKGKQIAGKVPSSSASSSGKRKSTRTSGESSGAAPKKRRSGVSRFVEDAAVDADYEGEEEESEDDLEWEIDDDFDLELPDIDPKGVMNETKGPRKSWPLPVLIKEEEMNDDELEEAIKERYRGSGFVSYDEDVKMCDESLLVAHATKDLFVWRVKCMMGRERQTAFCLMQKFVDLLKIGKKLQIFSVFALDHVKGFVYFEADKACNVLEACNGLCILYSSRIEHVPRNEVLNLLSIQKRACGISKGMWVRMKSGKYKGDLAEAVFVNDTKKRVTVKLVPRIDLQAIAKKFGGGASLKAAAIPTPRLISSHELEDFRPHIEVRRDRETGEILEVLDGLMLKDCYLYKKVSIGSLIHWGVQPSSDELAKFEDLGKDEDKDVSWLSSIYKTHIKKKLPETSHQKDGEKCNQKNGEKYNQKNGEKYNQKNGGKSDQKDEEKQRNGFDIDDLVLFGRKDCGIIIDKENDTFKVLKADANGSEVVSINIRVIKKNCIDKVFTATDRSMKTISIDDVVTVSNGPLEGREGIVRHMYKGVLFLYDECQSENNGFFCVKSDICELKKKSRDFRGGKSSNNAGPSFAQSPIRSSEQDDNSQSFSRNRQSNSRSTFSVGQTLRICKGPLKGYLCRVIRIHRADVTVKLDSLGKLLTVDENLLSCPNLKRDDATATQSDMFGSQEEQPTCGLLDASGGLGMDNFGFNPGTSSFGRDSWNTPSCSNHSFPGENDSKDQNQVADPWGSKLSSQNGDQDFGAANSWGKAPSSTAEQSSWNKMESTEKATVTNSKNDADAWNNASTKGETSTQGWQIDTPKGASSGWESAAEVVSDGGGWNKAKLSTPDSGQGQTSGGDGWNIAASKSCAVSNTETIGWEQSKLASSDAGGSWNNPQGVTADWNKETIGKEKTDGIRDQSANWASSKSGDGHNLDSRGIKGKGLLENNDDTWGKSAASQDTKSGSNNPWQSSFNSSVQSKPWKAPSADENQVADWHSSSLQRASQSISWDKASEKSDTALTEIAAGWAAAGRNSGTSSAKDGIPSNSWSEKSSLPSSSGWEKPKATVTETVGDWKTTKDGNQVASWDSAMPTGHHESQASGWNNASTSSSSSGWQISKQADTAERDGWKRDGVSNEGRTDGWNKEKSSDMDQASGWNKAGNAGGGKGLWGDSWDKAKSSEGHGVGQESRGQWKARDDWRNDQRDPNFEKSKDSDSGQGSGWSQGRSDSETGKSWARGGSWNQQRDFDGGRGYSRGRGRGRFGGRGGRNDDNNFEKQGDSNDGWRPGRGGGGRGRNGAGGYNRDNSDTSEFGRGRGRGRGQGRGPDQGQFQSSGWSSGRVETAGWNSGNKPGWGADPQDSDGSKNAMNEDHASSWSKETRNNVSWNTPKTLDDKPSSWNQTSQSTDWKNSTKAPNSSAVSWELNSNDRRETDTWNDEKEASGNQGGWSGKKMDIHGGQPSSETENNWGKFKEPSDNNSANWDSKREPASSYGTWGGKDSSGAQSSDWNSGGGNRWGEQSGDQGKPENWSRSTDFGRGGGRGRYNSFSRGRGFGRNSSGRHSSGWNSSNDSGKEGDDGGQAFNSNPNEEFRSRGGWNSGGNASKQGSDWAAPTSAPGSKLASSSADGSWNPGSSKGWSDDNSSQSSPWDSNKEPTPNWGGKDSSNGRSSNQEDGDGSKWNFQSGSQDKSESWSRQSGFGRGGGRGRGNSFSGGGRGFGRNSGGGRGYGKEGSDGRPPFNSNQEFKTGGSWNNSWGGSESGESQTDSGAKPGWASASAKEPVATGKSSWDSPAGFGGNQVSGWEPASSKVFVSKTSDATDSGEQKDKNPWGSENAQDPATTGKSSWNSPADSSSNPASGWEPDSSKNLTTKTSYAANSDQQKNNPWGSENAGEPAAASKSSWDSPAGFRSCDSSENLATKTSEATDTVEQKNNNPWGSANASKMGQNSAWSTGSSYEKQKQNLAESDRVGSWDANNASSKDGESNKLGSWNGKGSGWGS